MDAHPILMWDTADGTNQSMRLANNVVGTTPLQLHASTHMVDNPLHDAQRQWLV
jgi:hypothetical protein